MKLVMKLFLALSFALLCTASIIRPRVASSDIRAYFRASGIPLTARQDASCLSEAECGEGHLCAQFMGEPFCKEDCEGFCLPDRARGFICNCELPCATGICANPVPDGQPDNGFCSEGTDTVPFKCPGETAQGNRDDMKKGKPGKENMRKEPGEPDSGKKGRERDDEMAEPSSGAEDALGETFSSPEPTRDPSSQSSNEASTDEQPPPPASPRPTSTPSENPSSGASPVCISAHHLSQLPHHMLRFREHVLANVLCDAAGSCATGGHVVEFRGRGMTMRRYCEEVGCVRRVMHVNSPVYRPGLRVRAPSEGLRFTALAARFETLVEEILLARVVGFGF